MPRWPFDEQTRKPPSRSKGERKRRQREQLYARQDGRCHYCGEPVEFNKFTVDHVIPRSKGGKREMKNIVGACKWCNTAKADMDLNAFLEAVSRLQK